MHGVAVAHRARLADDRRHDELVVLAARVRRRERVLRASRRGARRWPSASASYALSRALPALVAIHRVEAARRPSRSRPRGRRARAALRAARGTLRRSCGGMSRPSRNASIAQRHAGRDARVDQRVEVVERAVDSAVGEQTHEVQRAAGRAHVLDARAQRRVRREACRRDRVVDDDDALRHDAAAADVDVADFAIAHHAFGQADGFAARFEQRVRVASRACGSSSAGRRRRSRCRACSARVPQPSRIARTSGARVRVHCGDSVRAVLRRAARRTSRDRGSRRRRVRRRCSAARRTRRRCPVSRCRRRAGARPASPATAARISPITAFGLGGESALPGADRPDRFVGDDAARDVGAGDARERRARLRAHARRASRPRRVLRPSRRPRRSA